MNTPAPALPAASASTATAGGGRTHVTIGSPVGPLTLVAGDGALVALYMHAQRHRPDEAVFGLAGDHAAEPFAAAASQLSAYFAGELTSFDLPLQPAGTAFQKKVWMALRDIPYGRTITYGELAAGIGSAAASRAVGLANGKNPISIVVPCHRVIGTDGSLTGYGGGLERKRFLLDLEGRAAERQYELPGVRAAAARDAHRIGTIPAPE
jgi:methylated-DNA-[protein]-cysteine S-methyltransferase